MAKIKIISTYIKLFFHLLRVLFQLINGIWKLSSLKGCPVTIFGGGRLLADSIYVKQAHELARKLKENNIPILTGGGLGIMEAANCAAYSRKKTKIIVSSVSIRVKKLDAEKKIRKCSNVVISLEYFFCRKWILMHYSCGFVIFPGGYGTLDEFMEVITLIQAKVLKVRPIVLVGTQYWKPFISWLNQVVFPMNLISKEDLELFTVTDSMEKAYSILSKNFKENVEILPDN